MIAVVILNWNGSAMMRRFLPSVIAGCTGEGEVIVADNGSTDDSLEMLRTEFPEVRVLPLDRNYGFAEGYNQAFRQLEAEGGGYVQHKMLHDINGEACDNSGEARDTNGEARDLDGEARDLDGEARDLDGEARDMDGEARDMDGEARESAKAAGKDKEAPHQHEASKEEHYDYYLLLNSDVECTDGWLRPLREYMDAHPDVAACQPKVRAEWDRTRLEYAGACGGFIDRDGYPFCRGRLFAVAEEDHGQYDDVADVFWATGAALMIRAEDWRRVGGLDGRFFAHNEEIDLCWRLRSRGRRIVCVPQSVVYHVGGGTLPQDNPRKTYLNFRNNLTMLYKNLPEGEMQRVLRRRTLLDWVAALQFIAKFDFANARAIFRARRDFKRWRPDFKADREANLAATVLHDIPERRRISLLWQYYARGRKCFSQLPQG